MTIRGYLWRGVLFGAIFAAVCAPAAQGRTLIATPAGGWPYQEWVNEALAPTPDATIEVVPDPAACQGQGEGCTSPGKPIWIDPAWPAQRRAFLHELGHQFDYLVMSDWARARFEQLVGETRPWTEDPNAPNEKFAEAWVWCATHPNLRRAPLNYSYEYRPTPALQAHVCHLLVVAYAATLQLSQ